MISNTSCTGVLARNAEHANLSCLNGVSTSEWNTAIKLGFQRGGKELPEVSLQMVVRPDGSGFIGRIPLGLSACTNSEKVHGEHFEPESQNVSDGGSRGDSRTAGRRDSEGKAGRRNGSDGGRARRGTKGISRRGRQQVRSACAVIEQETPKRLLSFLTLTIPFETPEELREAARHWPRAINLFQKRVRYRLEKAGYPLQGVWVNELQKRGALHSHMAFQGRRDCHSTWLFTPKELTAAWEGCWVTVLGDKCRRYNWGASTNVQRVKKSLVRYLGKYMSKGQGDIKDEGLCPSSWWGCTDILRKKVEECTFRHVFNSCHLDWRGVTEKLINCCPVRWIKYFELPSGYTWGIMFKTEPDWNWAFPGDMLIAYQ